MEIDALKSFLAFVETGSITRAAKQVNRTQSAVSMQMKKLEQDLGKQLFLKEGRNLILSQDGQTLVGYAKQLVATVEATKRALSGSEQKVSVRLGCPDDYAQSVLPKLVKVMHQHWPNLALSIRCLPSNVIKQELDAGEMDMGIITRAFDSEEGHLLATDTGQWVYNGDQNLLAQNPLPLVTFQTDCRFHHAAIEGLLKQETPFKLIATSGSVAAIQGLVQQGLAIAVLASNSRGSLTAITSKALPPLPDIRIVLVTNSQSGTLITQPDITSLCNAYRTL